jgi:hypothetical protein
MSPKDFLYNSTFKQFMAMGYSDRDAGYVAADAVNRWRRRGGASKAVKDAIALGKKQYKPRR